MTENSSIREILRKTARENRAANAYLLTGGTRDTRLREAEAFAEALATTEADIARVTHEKPNLISVDEVRDKVVRDALIRPYGSGKKVYIVDEAEKMNPQAQNALLKTLEEPPEYVVILLLADRKEYFLPTVLSRAVKLTLTEEETEEEAETPVRTLLRQGIRMKTPDVIRFVNEEQKNKEGRSALTAFLEAWFRDVLALKAGAAISDLSDPKDAAVLKEYAEHLSFEGIGRILREIGETEQKLRANVNFDITMNVLFSIIRTEMEKKNG